jgi:hypothetical protein
MLWRTRERAPPTTAIKNDDELKHRIPANSTSTTENASAFGTSRRLSLRAAAGGLAAAVPGQ